MSEHEDRSCVIWKHSQSDSMNRARSKQYRETERVRERKREQSVRFSLSVFEGVYAG